MEFLSAMKYSFINVRIRGRKAKLLNAANYESLLDAENIEELTRILAESDYHGLFQEAGNKLVVLDAQLNQLFIQEIKALVGYLPKASRRFMELYLRRSFLEGLKTVLRAFETETSWEDIQSLLVGSEDELSEFHELMTADSLSLMIKRITDPFIRNILQEQIELAESLKTTVPLELAIDRWYYASLWESTEKILRRSDRGVAQQFVGNQIDLLNIQALLRIKQHFPAFDERMIRDLLIPVNYLLGSALDRCVISVSPVEIFNHLLDTKYRNFARLARDSFEDSGSVREIEMWAKGYLHDLAFKMLLGQPFNIGAFLAYLLLKSTEIQNVRAIAVGIASGVDKATIRQHVLIP
ncbi:MAG: V-type ATPase subunit [Candidatus Thorarchaeota archaeon]